MAIDNEVLALLLHEVQAFVKRLPVNDVIRDDIVSNTGLLISERIVMIEAMGLERGIRWVRGATFLVARTTKRAEFRRTATWRRLRDLYEHNDTRAVFEEASREEQIVLLLAMLDALSDRDRQLLIGQIWDGHTCHELAELHRLEVQTVQKRLSRARQACRNVIEQEITKKSSV